MFLLFVYYCRRLISLAAVLYTVLVDILLNDDTTMVAGA